VPWRHLWTGPFRSSQPARQVEDKQPLTLTEAVEPHRVPVPFSNGRCRVQIRSPPTCSWRVLSPITQSEDRGAGKSAICTLIAYVIADAGDTSSCPAAAWKKHLPAQSGSRAECAGTAPGRAYQGRERHGGDDEDRDSESGLEYDVVGLSGLLQAHLDAVDRADFCFIRLMSRLRLSNNDGNARDRSPSGKAL
jgi:hypothetical protein